MHRTQGFSLVELMIAIAIMTILITVAIPSFQSTLIKMNTSSIADTLISSLNFARSEALNRNQRVGVCASLDGAVCDAGAADWDSGWLISTLTASGALVTVLRYKRISTQGADIRLEGKNDKTVVFKPSGEALLIAPEDDTAFGFNVQVDGCDDPQLTIRRVISIALSGSINVNSRMACDDGT